MSSSNLEEPLTLSHLLNGFRILGMPDPTITPDEDSYDPRVSSTDLTRRMKHLSKTLADIWRRWRTEYLLELREGHHYYPPPKGTDNPISTGDVVLVHDENLPRGLWRLGRIKELLPGADGNVRVRWSGSSQRVETQLSSTDLSSDSIRWNLMTRKLQGSLDRQ